MSQQGKRQAEARAIHGLPGDRPYEEDMRLAYGLESVISLNATFNEAQLAFINARLSVDYRNINDAMQAFATLENATNWSSMGTLSFPSGPVNSVPPVATGTPTVGELLSSTTGVWVGIGTIEYNYQWVNATDGDISGATSSTYTLQASDVGDLVFCRVTAIDAQGVTSEPSNSLGPVTYAVPVNTVAPVISGTPTVGQTLTSTTGTWTGSPTITYAYQWKSGASNVGTNANIYVLVTGDIGANITCVVTATNPGGSTNATSNSLGPVVAVTSTWNPSDKATGITLTNGNLTATSSAASENVRSSLSRSVGQWHVEFTRNAGNFVVGLVTSAANLNVDLRDDTTGVKYSQNGQVRVGNSVVATIEAASTGAVVSFEQDGTNVYIQVGSGGPRRGPYALPGGAAQRFPVFGALDASDQATLNVGASAFTITPTSGFTAWG